ncbi:MAG TPA: diguanylate cyclase [Vicinamibacterales bacterium]|nr:diguanylate cyclase [Vicinamibacterales bacterium]
MTPLPFEALAEIAITVVHSPDLQSAIELLASDLARLFSTRVTVFEKQGRQWTAIAGAERVADQRDWQASLTAVLAATPALVPGTSGREEHVTAISLTGPSGPDLALVLDGDWTADPSTLKVFALLVSIGLDSLRQRDDRRAIGRRLVAAYAMARRLSRRQSVEQIAQQIVDHIAELLDADRVSLALFEKNEDALSIAATHGYPLAHVKHVRVPAGAWVIGHVYSHARPIFVDDDRFFPGVRRDHYRTRSFAVVPLLSGNEPIGVLSVTGKRQVDRFDRDDELVLRGLSVIAALALDAARGTTEAAKLAHAATVDSVTSLLNRPYLDNRLREEIARSKREATTLAILIADIDDFKRINDAFGHQAGDEVLRVVGSIIRSAVRVFDVCARYGGDEFAILMPNCDRDSAIACAERIRARVAAYDGSRHGAGFPSLTMSIGAAVIEKDEDAPALIARADRYLYQAKADGKNLVRAESADDGWQPTTDVEPDQGLIRRARGPYVLIADANEERSALCAGIVKRFGMAVTIARSSHQAASILSQAGPPALLIIDLSLRPADGFAVIDALNEERPPDIIAWSPSREMTEYAASRLRWPSARVLSGGAPPSTISAAVEKILGRHGERTGQSTPVATAPEQADKVMRTLAEKTRELCDAAGVAVYLKATGDTGFRTYLHWTSNESMPHLPFAVPRAFNHVVETGRAIVVRDRRDRSSSDDIPREGSDDVTRGLAAFPILFDREVIGAICVFDVEPLTLTDHDAAALAAIGRDAFSSAVAEAPLSPGAAGATPFRDRAIDRRAQTGAREVRPAGSPSEWPPTILERQGGEFAVARELARARREGRQLSVVLFDVGTAAADSVEPHSPEHLEAVSDTLLRAIRQSDLPIRWSVSELLVVLPGLTGSEARSVAERVRAALQAGTGHRLSVSGGVAELATDERFADVVDRARQKVAMAVGRGHNRVL